MWRLDTGKTGLLLRLSIGLRVFFAPTPANSAHLWLLWLTAMSIISFGSNIHVQKVLAFQSPTWSNLMTSVRKLRAPCTPKLRKQKMNLKKQRTPCSHKQRKLKSSFRGCMFQSASDLATTLDANERWVFEKRRKTTIPNKPIEAPTSALRVAHLRTSRVRKKATSSFPYHLWVRLS